MTAIPFIGHIETPYTALEDCHAVTKKPRLQDRRG
jgi:hypothetical protein